MILTSSSLRRYSDVVFDIFYYRTEYEFNQLINVDLNGKTVFVNGDLLECVLNHLKKFYNMNIIIHSTDRTIDYLMISPLMKHCKYIHSVNCNFFHAKVKQIPLGFQDVNTRYLCHHNKRPFDQTDYDVNKTKTRLCYMNFSLYHTDEPKFEFVKSTRNDCFNTLKYNHWIDKESDKLEYKEFIQKLATFKFAICPVGFGIDTHRFYECAIVGTRPIVLSSPLDDMYRPFNPLIVNEWSDITEELLESQDEYVVSSDVFDIKYWIH